MLLHINKKKLEVRFRFHKYTSHHYIKQPVLKTVTFSGYRFRKIYPSF